MSGNAKIAGYGFLFILYVALFLLLGWGFQVANKKIGDGKLSYGYSVLIAWIIVSILFVIIIFAWKNKSKIAAGAKSGARRVRSSGRSASRMSSSAPPRVSYSAPPSASYSATARSITSQDNAMARQHYQQYRQPNSYQQEQPYQ